MACPVQAARCGVPCCQPGSFAALQVQAQAVSARSPLTAREGAWLALAVSGDRARLLSRAAFSSSAGERGPRLLLPVAAQPVQGAAPTPFPSGLLSRAGSMVLRLLPRAAGQAALPGFGGWGQRWGMARSHPQRRGSLAPLRRAQLGADTRVTMALPAKQEALPGAGGEQGAGGRAVFCSRVSVSPKAAPSLQPACRHCLPLLLGGGLAGRKELKQPFPIPQL